MHHFIAVRLFQQIPKKGVNPTMKLLLRDLADVGKHENASLSIWPRSFENQG
jgi:hypothetical protein